MDHIVTRVLRNEQLIFPSRQGSQAFRQNRLTANSIQRNYLFASIQSNRNVRFDLNVKRSLWSFRITVSKGNDCNQNFPSIARSMIYTFLHKWSRNETNQPVLFQFHNKRPTLLSRYEDDIRQSISFHADCTNSNGRTAIEWILPYLIWSWNLLHDFLC